MDNATLFRSVDTGAFAAAFTAKLRAAGLKVGMSETGRFSAALAKCPPTDVRTLYWVAKTCLIGDRDDFEVFNDVFDALFNDESLPIPPGRSNQGRATVKSTGTVIRQSVPSDGLEIMAGRTTRSLAPEIVDDDDGPEPIDDSVIPELLPASIAELADTPFDQLSDADLAVLGAWLETALVDFPQRRSRRSRSSNSGGQIDMRATLLAARATAGEPVRLQRRRPRLKPRGIVVLTDVSGSMESFARMYLHLMRSLVVHGDAEVFTFATSLRRVTVPLRESDPQAAIDRLSDEVADRFSGTRIASSIGELVTSPVWSNSVRGSLVIVASDGWDTDDPAELEYHMNRLHRMAYRVVWINPRVAGSGYEPLVGGMAAALPFVDELLSGHSLNAMRQVLTALSD